MSTITQLTEANDLQREFALKAADAAEDLARVANGHREHVIPAPTAYDLLGELKVLLWHLKEVADYLPTGIQAALGDPRLDVYDRDVATGADRDPVAQATLAAHRLRDLSAALDHAATAAEAAQTALNGQGYNVREVRPA